jgi:hypothetical protein
MILHVTLNRECFAQNLATQGQFVGESEEGLAFANGDFGGEFRSIAANAKPLRYLHYKIFALSRCSAGSEHKNLVDANMPDKASEAIEGNQRNETMIHSL